MAEEMKAQAMGWPPMDFLPSARFYPPYPIPMNPNMPYPMPDRHMMPYYPYPQERRMSSLMPSNTSENSLGSQNANGHSSTPNIRRDVAERQMGGGGGGAGLSSMQNPPFERPMVATHMPSASSVATANGDNPYASSSSHQSQMMHGMPPWMNGQYSFEDNNSNMFYPPWYNAFMSQMQGGSPSRSSNRDHGPPVNEYDPRYPNNMSSRENTDHEYYYPNHP